MNKFNRIPNNANSLLRSIIRTEGICIAQKDQYEFQEDFKHLKQIYTYPFARLEWGNGYLSRIIADGGDGTWIDLYLHQTMGQESYDKVYTNNTRHIFTALFYCECLASYLRHSRRIQIPHIETKVINRKNTVYSFPLPLKTNMEQLQRAVSQELSDTKRTVKITNEGILLNEHPYVSFVEANGIKWMVAERISELPIAVKLFYSLSSHLKDNLYD